MPSPYAEAAAALETIINAEFAPEGRTAAHDNLHPAVGDQGLRIGIAPEDETAMPGNMVVNTIGITVKFYNRWDAEVDQYKRVDPRPITEYADRFRQAVRRHNGVSTGKLWYFNLTRIRYPNDPTGNKTRFEADIVAFGNNTGLVETTG